MITFICGRPLQINCSPSQVCLHCFVKSLNKPCIHVSERYSYFPQFGQKLVLVLKSVCLSNNQRFCKTLHTNVSGTIALYWKKMVHYFIFVFMDRIHLELKICQPRYAKEIMLFTSKDTYAPAQNIGQRLLWK